MLLTTLNEGSEVLIVKRRGDMRISVEIHIHRSSSSSPIEDVTQRQRNLTIERMCEVASGFRFSQLDHSEISVKEQEYVSDKVIPL